MSVASFGQSKYTFRRSKISMIIEIDENQTLHNSKNHSYIYGGSSFKFTFDAVHGHITSQGGAVKYIGDGNFICYTVGGGLVKIFVYGSSNELIAKFIFILNPENETK
jgi:hypothetical protein